MPFRNNHLKGAMGKTSGKLVVGLLFGGAFLLFGILFTVAYKQKLLNQSALATMNASEYTDSAMTNSSIQNWMTNLPSEWVKVTFVEGQGYVIFTPCYTRNSTLKIKSDSDKAPMIMCEYCDSSSEYRINSIGKVRRDSAYEFKIVAENGIAVSNSTFNENNLLRIVKVTDSIQLQFPDAPFKEKLLIWTKANAGGKIDSLIFVPKTQESEFETLKAEDENPEGCKEEPSD